MSDFSTPELIQAVFGDALSKYTSSLLCKVCIDYELDFAELSARYTETADGMSFFTTSQAHEIQKGRSAATDKKPKVPRVAKEDKIPCIGQTSKGGPCKFAAMTGSEMCGIHQRKSEGLKPEKKPKEPKEPKKSKKKSSNPVHTHELTEDTVEDCDLCQSHGNVLNKGLAGAEFEASVEGGVSIQDRLKAIISETEEVPEKTVEVPEKTVEVPEKTVEVPKKTVEVPKKAVEVPKKAVEVPARWSDEVPDKTEEVPKKVIEFVKNIEEQKQSGFIRAKVRGKRPEPKPVEDVAGPSIPVNKADDGTEDIRSKLRMILAMANEDSDSDEEDTEFDEEDAKARLAQKLSEGFEMDEDEEMDDEMDIEQMCDTPESQAALQDAWASLKIEE